MENMILTVSFTVFGRVKVDLARAQDDPWWDKCAMGKDLNDPIQLQNVVADYLATYLRHEDLLSNAPFTCGPADVYNTKIEVINDGSHSNDAT